MMSKENKDNKPKRDLIAREAETEYLARKKRYAPEIPKYMKATLIELEGDTFKGICY
jgi:hypothetical protein